MKYTVYLIRHISTGTVLYVGKTKDFQRRKKEHLSLKTRTKKWLEVIGTVNVFIEPVAEFNKEVDALKYEDKLILKYNTIENGYNKQRSGLIKAENPEEYKKEYNKEYQKTDKYREYSRDYYREYYKKNDKYREWQREYHKTDKYREYIRAYNRDYYHSKKLGLTIEEYRKINTEIK